MRRVVVLAGPNGAGKSSTAHLLIPESVEEALAGRVGRTADSRA